MVKGGGRRAWDAVTCCHALDVNCCILQYNYTSCVYSDWTYAHANSSVDSVLRVLANSVSNRYIHACTLGRSSLRLYSFIGIVPSRVWTEVYNNRTVNDLTARMPRLDGRSRTLIVIFTNTLTSITQPPILAGVYHRLHCQAATVHWRSIAGAAGDPSLAQDVDLRRPKRQQTTSARACRKWTLSSAYTTKLHEKLMVCKTLVNSMANNRDWWFSSSPSLHAHTTRERTCQAHHHNHNHHHNI